MFRRHLALIALMGCNTVYGLDDLSYSEDPSDSDPPTAVDDDEGNGEGTGEGNGEGNGGGNGEGTSGGNGGGIGEGIGGSPGGDRAPALVGDKLVARYFIDDAVSGAPVGGLADAADEKTPLSLHLDFSEHLELVLSLTAPDGRGALSWIKTGEDARASVAVAGTNFEDKLQDSPQATLEAVVNLDAVSDLRSRIIHFGYWEKNGFLTLASKVPDTVDAFWNNKPLGRWDITFGKRQVIHLVVDIELDEDQRVKLYVDGNDLHTPTVFESDGITSGPPSDTLDLKPPDGETYKTYFVLGNREMGERSFKGKLHYAAVYATALTKDEVGANASALMDRDDR